MSAPARPALVAVAGLALLAVLGTGTAWGQGQGFSLRGQGRDRDEDFRRADPAQVVAVELAFARAAQEKGQWTAFAEYATDDAVMFVPQPVNAQTWLEGRANPPQAVRWQPHQVWSSCDGSLAVSKGAWQRPDGSVGYFTTVWQRQEKKKDGYRWVLDQGDVLPEPLTRPEMIEAKTADCTTRPTTPILVTSARIGSILEGKSDDETLYWQVVMRGDGSQRSVSMYLWDGSAWQDLLLGEVAAQ